MNAEFWLYASKGNKIAIMAASVGDHRAFKELCTIMYEATMRERIYGISYDITSTKLTRPPMDYKRFLEQIHAEHAALIAGGLVLGKPHH